MENKTMRTGFIAIVGRPNAGKSTLINKLVEEKVSIVTWRPQTTRDKIIGIYNGEDYQAVFIDTPGIHTAKNKLSDYMMRSINNSLMDVDAILYIIDGTSYISDIDRDFIEKLRNSAPLIIALNKVDTADREKYVKTLSMLNDYKKAKSIYPISAKRGDNVDKLKDELINLLPEGNKMYPDDMYTDKTLRFMVSEIIREKALMFLNQEIPYGVGININSYSRRENKNLIDIDADIICEREQHKAIIIGKNATMLKKIGERARYDIEKLVGSKVNLKLYVKVNKNWRDNVKALEDLGYN